MEVRSSTLRGTTAERSSELAHENSRYGSTKVLTFGGLAQLARAPALQAGGQRFESVILHCLVRFLIVLEMIFDILTNVKAMTIDT